MKRMIVRITPRFAKAAEQGALFGPIKSNPELRKKKLVDKRGRSTTRYVRPDQDLWNRERQQAIQAKLTPDELVQHLRRAATLASDKAKHEAYWKRVASGKAKGGGGEAASGDDADVPRIVGDFPTRWKVDNPLVNFPDEADHAREWLEDNPETITANFRGMVAADELAELPGARNEQDHMQDDASREKIERLGQRIRDEGYNAKHEITVRVDKNGRATVWEGNHRIRAAQAIGLERLPTRVFYEGGSEQREDAWRPTALREHLQQQAEPEAAEPEAEEAPLPKPRRDAMPRKTFLAKLQPHLAKGNYKGRRGKKRLAFALAVSRYTGEEIDPEKLNHLTLRLEALVTALGGRDAIDWRDPLLDAQVQKFAQQVGRSISAGGLRAALAEAHGDDDPYAFPMRAAMEAWRGEPTPPEEHSDLATALGIDRVQFTPFPPSRMSEDAAKRRAAHLAATVKDGLRMTSDAAARSRAYGGSASTALGHWIAASQDDDTYLAARMRILEALAREKKAVKRRLAKRDRARSDASIREHEQAASFGVSRVYSDWRDLLQLDAMRVAYKAGLTNPAKAAEDELEEERLATAEKFKRQADELGETALPVLKHRAFEIDMWRDGMLRSIQKWRENPNVKRGGQGATDVLDGLAERIRRDADAFTQAAERGDAGAAARALHGLAYLPRLTARDYAPHGSPARDSDADYMTILRKKIDERVRDAVAKWTTKVMGEIGQAFAPGRADGVQAATGLEVMNDLLTAYDRYRFHRDRDPDDVLRGRKAYPAQFDYHGDKIMAKAEQPRLILHLSPAAFAKAVEQGTLFGPIKNNPDLVKKPIIDKRGRRSTRYVRPKEERDADGPRTASPVGQDRDVPREARDRTDPVDHFSPLDEWGALRSGTVAALRSDADEGGWPDDFRGHLSGGLMRLPAAMRAYLDHRIENPNILGGLGLQYHSTLDHVPDFLRATYEGAKAVTINHSRIEFYGDRYPDDETLRHELVHLAWGDLYGMGRRAGTGPAAPVVEEAIEEAAAAGLDVVQLSRSKAFATRDWPTEPLPGVEKLSRVQEEGDEGAALRATVDMWITAKSVRRMSLMWRRIARESKWKAMEGIPKGLEISLSIPDSSLPLLFEYAGHDQFAEPRLAEIATALGKAKDADVPTHGAYAIEEPVAYKAGLEPEFAERLFATLDLPTPGGDSDDEEGDGDAPSERDVRAAWARDVLDAAHARMARGETLHVNTPLRITPLTKPEFLTVHPGDPTTLAIMDRGKPLALTHDQLETLSARVDVEPPDLTRFQEERAREAEREEAEAERDIAAWQAFMKEHYGSADDPDPSYLDDLAAVDYDQDALMARKRQQPTAAHRIRLSDAQVSALESRMHGTEQVDGLQLDGDTLLVDDPEEVFRILTDVSNAEGDAAEYHLDGDAATFARRASRSVDAIARKVAALMQDA